MKVFVSLMLSLFCHSCFAAAAVADGEDLAARFPDLKVVQESGLPVRVAREDWDGARRRVARDDAWKAWLKTSQRALDGWMSKPRDRAEWVAGYMHALIDPVSGLPLKWSANMPAPPIKPSPDNKFHEAWVAWVRTNNIDNVREASRLFRLTGEQRYADWAVEQIDLYADNYALWPLQQLWGSRSRMIGQGLDEATATVRLLDAVRLLKDQVTPEKHTKWRDMLFLPIADNLRKADVGINNISLWHAAAIAEIGLHYGDESLIREGIDGPMGIRAIMKVGVTSDFIWYEGSLGYQTYVLRALAPLFVQASLHGRAHDLKREMLIAQNMLLAPLALRFDDGMLPTPGDATARQKAVDLNFLMEMYRTLPTRIGLIEATRRKNWDTLLDPADVDLSVAARLPAVKSVNLDSIRMAVLKAGGWQVFLRYGQLTSYHSQEDALNTEVYYGDLPVSTAPATLLYESSLHKDYFRRAIAHNVPLVDGQGQAGWNPGVMLRFDADAPALTVSQPKLRPDATATRDISIQDDQLVDRLSLRLKPEVRGVKRLGFIFHSDCDVEFVKDKAVPASAAVPPVGRGFQFWEDITVRPSPREAQVRLHCGKRDFAIELRLSAPGLVYAAMVPSTPLPKKRSVMYVEIAGREAFVEMRLLPGELKEGRP
jgi:hypothetical protein